MKSSEIQGQSSFEVGEAVERIYLAAVTAHRNRGNHLGTLRVAAVFSSERILAILSRAR